MGVELTEKVERWQLGNWGHAWESGTYLLKPDGLHFINTTPVPLSFPPDFPVSGGLQIPAQLWLSSHASAGSHKGTAPVV